MHTSLLQTTQESHWINNIMNFIGSFHMLFVLFPTLQYIMRKIIGVPPNRGKTRELAYAVKELLQLPVTGKLARVQENTVRYFS